MTVHNGRTRTLKLRRGDVIDVLIALACIVDEGTSVKWDRLHAEIKRQLDEQDEKESAAG